MKKEKHKGKPKIPGKRETKGKWKEKTKRTRTKTNGRSAENTKMFVVSDLFQTGFRPTNGFVNLGNWKEEVNEEKTNRQTCNGRKGRNCLVCDKTEIE